MATCDPNYTDVVLLLHMDGADNGTSFPDDSSYAHTVTRTGAPVTMTAAPKFGTAALAVPASVSYLSVADATEFDLSTTDFTIELWVKYTNTDIGGNTFSIIDKTLADSRFPFQMIVADNNTITVNGANQSGTTLYNLSSGINAFTDGVWCHVAFTRAGNTVRLFTNGVLKASATIAGALANMNFPWHFGGRAGTNSLLGYWDDLRISRIARYTANFTPPTEEFGLACPIGPDPSIVTIYTPFVSSPVFRPAVFSNLEGARPTVWPVASPTLSRKQP